MLHEANHPVRTTEKSLEVITTLRDLDGARINALEDHLDMTKGAIHNHLSTLREHGLVVKVGNEYRLGTKFLTLGGHVRSGHELFRYGRQKADQLARDTGMLVNLMTEEGGKGVYLYQARGDYAVNLDTHVGYRIRLHNIAIGKAILGFLPRPRVEEIIDTHGLPRATENTITDPEEFFDELELIQERGYATEREERTEGLSCIGAPIQVNDRLLGAISISGPTRRLGIEQFDEEIIGQVESTANELSLDIKYK